MVAAAYMADRATFDGLWTYAKLHLDAKGLMNWQISSGGGTVAAGSASDGDVDIIWGLIMASEQWSATSYLDDAKKQIVAMRSNSISRDGMLLPGDGWGADSVMTNPSYFAPAYFRVFARVTSDNLWAGAILDRNYQILAAVAGSQGLVPDWSNNASAVNQGLLSTDHDSSTYSYDATRTPWRIAMDYCFNDEARAKAYLTKVGAFFNGVGASNIADAYSVTGAAKGSGDKNMAFIGPAGTAGMAGYQTLLDGAFNFGVSATTGDYFKDSLRVITMLMMSGNMLDYSKPLP
jgi:endo-1,4-beta-D-glucanase Y